MKAYDIYKRACAIMFEREVDDKAFLENFVELLNALLCECLPYENSVRESRGREKLLSAPTVSSIDDTVDMCFEICNIALPYGIASYFCKDDGEVYSSELYRARFISALDEAAKHCLRDVEDVYGGDDI